MPNDMTTRPTTAPAPAAVCGAVAYLPLHLLGAALAFAAPGTAQPADVERYLRCTLQAHPEGAHFALVMELDGADTGSVWTRWTTGEPPAILTVLPDCSAARAEDGEPCCEWQEHPGGHSYEVADTWPAR
jgi:hypothetical protein